MEEVGQSIQINSPPGTGKTVYLQTMERLASKEQTCSYIKYVEDEKMKDDLVNVLSDKVIIYISFREILEHFYDELGYDWAKFYEALNKKMLCRLMEEVYRTPGLATNIKYFLKDTKSAKLKRNSSKRNKLNRKT